jgi:phage shock protein C
MYLKKSRVVSKNDSVKPKGEKILAKRLYRSRSDRILGGVCGGIAAHLEIDISLIRILWILLALAGGPGLIAYIICWIIIPEAPSYQRFQKGKADNQPPEPEEVVQEELHADVNAEVEKKVADDFRDGGRRTIGVILILVGIFFFFRQAGSWFIIMLNRLLPGVNWSHMFNLTRTMFWPSLLIAFGVILLLGSRGRNR